LAARIRFYLDENLHVAIARQLRKYGIDVVTVRDLGLLGESDINHLVEATAQGRVLCTNDADYVQIATSGIAHAGIIFGQQHKHGVGEWVHFLELVYTVYEPEEMKNRIEYVLV
jgi:uncharacterized protein with PIN domain